MQYFVPKNSIVRKIWSKSDTVIFIFAGSAAEFALNKAVDWLYYTGKLPADPIGRLFSTVAYARQIVYSENEAALKAIDNITGVHTAIETSRQQQIPDWAYRDVLFMLIHYSIASYELLERKLSDAEKEDVFDVFARMAVRMHLKGLPQNFSEWKIMRNEHLKHDLHNSDYTINLFKQYKNHLGYVRYQLLLQGQILVVPPHVKHLLGLGNFSWLRLVIPFYKFSRALRLDRALKWLIFPVRYQDQIKGLDWIAQ
ncbi:MAG TPA: oxygenase MpaB family protein [Saprospiraceae bacterium]|nr:oxygenase MpaB family protein [Saprospiraceae bacterium]